MSIAALAGRDGSVVGVAVDNRDLFRAALAAKGLIDASEELVAAIKSDVCRTLAPVATMVLVDEPAHAGGTPFAMPLEAQGSGELHEVTLTRLLERPTIDEMVAAGAAGTKLLLPFRPDHVDRAQGQRTVAAAPDESLAAERLGELVVEAAELLASLQPGLLKLQYPGSREACERLHAACGGHPWVLLGGGAPLADLEGQLIDACAAGASGCIVGRSLFDGALDEDADRRRAWLEGVARPALERLARIVAAPSRRPELPARRVET